MTVELKPGKYLIGDPCYMLNDTRYVNLCDELDRLNYDGGLAVIDGKELAVFSTKYGDGDYKDQFGNRYPVDAGIIGCVPVELADKGMSGCLLVEFDRAFLCEGGDGTRHWSGTLQFGKYQIETGDFESDDFGDYDD